MLLLTYYLLQRRALRTRYLDPPCQRPVLAAHACLLPRHADAAFTARHATQPYTTKTLPILRCRGGALPCSACYVCLYHRTRTFVNEDAYGRTPIALPACNLPPHRHARVSPSAISPPDSTLAQPLLPRVCSILFRYLPPAGHSLLAACAANAPLLCSAVTSPPAVMPPFLLASSTRTPALFVACAS